jgi:hypothetical protein
MATFGAGDRQAAKSLLRGAVDDIENGKPILYDEMGPLAVKQLRNEAEELIVDR